MEIAALSFLGHFRFLILAFRIEGQKHTQRPRMGRQQFWPVFTMAYNLKGHERVLLRVADQ